MHSIIELDHIIFSIINGAQLPPWLDTICTLWRNELFWIPVYVLIISFFVFNFKSKFYLFVLAGLLTVATSDLVSSRWIKNSIKRTRPCNTELVGLIERVPCGSGYSFTSSHATNHFALSSFLFFLFGRYLKNHKWWLLIWAASISIAQIYVGKHYPIDVLVGATLGCLIGWMGSMIFERSNQVFGWVDY